MSSSYHDGPHCKVWLDTYLQDDDTSEKVAGSEFVVGRVAHGNNTSDYLIDGRKQTAKVVVERLKQEGIDLNHNRFLILQVGRLMQCTVQRTGSGSSHAAEQVLPLCKPSTSLHHQATQCRSRLQRFQRPSPLICRARWSRSA